MKKQTEEKTAIMLSGLLKALSHPFRLRIVCSLLDKQLYAQEITDRLGTTKGNISQHLTILLESGIIERTLEKNRTIYELKDQKIRKVIKVIKEQYCPDFTVD